jgi:type I restriction enzyme S subunit
MNGKQLKNSILQWAIQGKLVPQDPNDEPASVLLEKIRQEKERLIKEKKIKRDKNASVIYRGEDNSYYEKMLATGEVKCIDKEIPFEIPQGWEWCRLNDLALYRKGPFGSSLTKSMFVAKSNQSVKVYEQKNAIQKNFRLGDYYISKEKFEAMQSFIVKPNDIIVSCAGTIGETYLLPLDAPVGIINQALMRVTLFDLSMAEYWQMYFAYMLLNEAQMKGAGSAIKNIPPFEYLKAVLVPVPPLSEQTRLVERYNLLLSLIAKYESEADKLNCLNLNIYDKLKKSVLQEAIQGKLVPQIAEEGTAQELLEQIKAEKQKLVKEGKLKKSALNDSVIFKGDDNKYYEQIGKICLDITEQIPFDLPSSWNWVRGKTVFMPMESIKPSSDFVYIDVDAVNNRKNIIEKPKMVKKEYAPSRATRKLHKNDLLFSMVRPYLKNIALVDEKYKNAIASTGFYVITPSLGYYPMFLFYLMLSNYVVEGLNSFMKGDNSPSINNCHIEDYLYPLPPIEEQKRIVNKIDQLFKQLR